MLKVRSLLFLVIGSQASLGTSPRLLVGGFTAHLFPCRLGPSLEPETLRVSPNHTHECSEYEDATFFVYSPSTALYLVVHFYFAKHSSERHHAERLLDGFQ